MALSHAQFVLPLQAQVTALENQVDEDEGHLKCKACKTCKTMSGICKVRLFLYRALTIFALKSTSFAVPGWEVVHPAVPTDFPKARHLRLRSC